MATFYVLPPRPLFGQQIMQFLLSWFPGLKCDAATSGELAETVSATACRQPGVFILFREDLPEGVEMQQALIDDFGAEPGDEIVEVAVASVRRWRLTGVGGPTQAAVSA